MRAIKHKPLVDVALLIVLLVIAAAAFVFDLVDFEDQRPDLYNPGREALIEAEWQLRQSVPHGPSENDPSDLTAQQVYDILDELEKARDAEPAHRERIGRIRARVAMLQQVDREVHASTLRRTELYDSIVSEIDELLSQYTQGNLGQQPTEPRN